MSDLVLLKNNQIEYIGDFEPDLFITYMSRYRKFNKQRIINYLHNVYGCPKEVIQKDKRFFNFLNKYCEAQKDIYSDFYKTDDYRKHDDKSRDMFNRQVRKKYVEFTKNWESNKCLVSGFFDRSEVHHIYPLIYGGGNELENLIFVSDIVHELLHENPKESSPVYCNVALDHLLLSFRGYPQFIFDTVTESGGNKELAANIYLQKIRDKMHQFYNQLFY